MTFDKQSNGRRIEVESFCCNHRVTDTQNVTISARDVGVGSGGRGVGRVCIKYVEDSNACELLACRCMSDIYRTGLRQLLTACAAVATVSGWWWWWRCWRLGLSVRSRFAARACERESIILTLWPRFHSAAWQRVPSALYKLSYRRQSVWKVMRRLQIVYFSLYVWPIYVCN